MASASAVGIAGRRDQPAAAFPRDRRRLGARIGRGDVGTAGGENAVDLARHDEAFEAALERHDEGVGGRERVVQQRLGLIGKEPDVVEPARRRPSPRARGAWIRRRRWRSSAAPSTAGGRPPRSAPRGSARGRRCPSASPRTDRRARAPARTHCPSGPARSRRSPPSCGSRGRARGSAPFSSTSRRRMRSPSATIASAWRSR